MMITGGFVPSRTVKPSCSSPFTVHSSIACETIRTSGELLQALPRSYAREANGVAIHGPHLHSPTVSWSLGAHANRVASVTPLQTFLPFLFSFRHTFDKGLAPLDSREALVLSPKGHIEHALHPVHSTRSKESTWTAGHASLVPATA